VSTIDTRRMLEEALMLAFAEASAKHVRLELEAPDKLPSIHGDYVQLEQVVLNLVHNAVEAITGAGLSEGRVRVMARQETAPPRVEIGVLDNGPVSKPSWLLACSTRWRLQSKMASAFRSARRLSRPTEDASGSIAATPVERNSGFHCRSVNRKCSAQV
jgi:hypothetical protein